MNWQKPMELNFRIKRSKFSLLQHEFVISYVKSSISRELFGNVEQNFPFYSSTFFPQQYLTFHQFLTFQFPLSNAFFCLVQAKTEEWKLSKPLHFTFFMKRKHRVLQHSSHSDYGADIDRSQSTKSVDALRSLKARELCVKHSKFGEISELCQPCQCTLLLLPGCFHVFLFTSFTDRKLLFSTCCTLSISYDTTKPMQVQCTQLQIEDRKKECHSR